MKSIFKIAFVLTIGGLIPSTVYATNGYFAIGYGLKSRGLAGAGVAIAQDSLIAATNPAGMVHVGSRFDVGARYFRPIRRARGIEAGHSNPAFNHPDPNFSTTSGKTDFIIPNLGYNKMLDDKMSFGFAMIGNGGMNTTYSNNFFDIGASGIDQKRPLGVDLMQLLILPTLSYKFNDSNSFGVTPIIGAQFFAATGLGDFGTFQFSKDARHLTDNGHDSAYGYGLRLGWQGHYLDDLLSFGAAVSSKVYMSKFHRYKGLFAEGGDFDIPANYTVGLAIKPTSSRRLTILFDYQKIMYSEVDSVANRHPTDCFIGSIFCSGGIPQGEEKLGGDDGIGFGWVDMDVYKLGFLYEHNDKWTWRLGFNYGETPIPDDQLLFNLLAPAVVEEHLAFGFTYAPNQKTEWTMSFFHAFSNTQECISNDGLTAANQPRGCETLFTGPGVPAASLPPSGLKADMSQSGFGLSYGVKF